MSEFYDNEMIEGFESNVPIVHLFFNDFMIIGTLFQLTGERSKGNIISLRVLTNRLLDYIEMFSNNKIVTILLNEKLFIKDSLIHKYEFHDIDYVEGSCILTINHNHEET